ncbi:MAG: UDP-3-O-acyl-N-acetylglucosamine deacetylase, partial [Myxococcota bacterium]
GKRWIRVEPAREFRISYAVEFDHPLVRRQEFSLNGWDPGRFEREIAAARTFGFLNDVRSLWAAGLAKGGSLENTLVLDDEGVKNPDGLRWPDEFVRHKVLDLHGDLALLGLPIEGHVRAERGGHALHQRLVSAVIADPHAWRIHPGGRVAAAIDLAPLLPGS